MDRWRLLFAGDLVECSLKPEDSSVRREEEPIDATFTIGELFDALHANRPGAKDDFKRAWEDVSRRLRVSFRDLLDEMEIEDAIAQALSSLVDEQGEVLEKERDKKFVPWLSAAGRNRVVDRLRSRRRAESESDPDVIPTGPWLDERATMSDEEALVADFHASLTEEDRAILDAFAESLGRRGWVDAIANKLKLTPDAVRQRKKRLVDRLSLRIEQNRESHSRG